MYITQLNKPEIINEVLYDYGETGHTFVVIRDGQNSFVVESNKDGKYNKVVITPFKIFIFLIRYLKQRE